MMSLCILLSGGRGILGNAAANLIGRADVEMTTRASVVSLDAAWSCVWSIGLHPYHGQTDAWPLQALVLPAHVSPLRER